MNSLTWKIGQNDNDYQIYYFVVYGGLHRKSIKIQKYTLFFRGIYQKIYVSGKNNLKKIGGISKNIYF